MEVGGSSASHARLRDRPIAEAFITRLQRRLSEQSGAGAFRLRFDRVALRFGAQVDEALRDVIPAGTTVLVAIAAPLRQPAKAAAELSESIDAALKKNALKNDMAQTLYGNQIFVRIARGRAGTRKAIVVVHNPHPNAHALLDAAQSALEGRSCNNAIRKTLG